MDKQAITNEISFLERALKREKAFRFFLLAFCVVLIFSFTTKESEKIIIMQTIDNDTSNVALKKDSASKDYLISFTKELLDYAFVYSPASADERMSKLLRVVSPEDYGAMKKYIVKKLEEVRKANVSSVFYAKDFKVQEATQSVVVTGVLMTLSNSKVVSNSQVSIKFMYRVNNFKINLIGFKDVTNKRNPFESGEE